MRIEGKRADGALWLSIGAGMSVLLRGAHVSKPLDTKIAMQMGPWDPSANTLADRREAERQLTTARVIALPQFSLTKPRSAYAGGRYPSEGDAPEKQGATGAGEAKSKAGKAAGLSHTDEKDVVDAVQSAWSYIAGDYGRTTAKDELGAALDRVSFLGKDKNASEKAKNFIEHAKLADVQELLKAHGVKRLGG